MEMFRTFPTDQPGPSARLARARVDGQEDVLMGMTGPLFESLVNRTAGQDAALTEVYRPLIARAQQAVRDQQSVTDGVVSDFLAAARTRVADQSALVDTLRVQARAAAACRVPPCGTGTAAPPGSPPLYPAPPPSPDPGCPLYRPPPPGVPGLGCDPDGGSTALAAATAGAEDRGALQVVPQEDANGCIWMVATFPDGHTEVIGFVGCWIAYKGGQSLTQCNPKACECPYDMSACPGGVPPSPPVTPAAPPVSPAPPPTPPPVSPTAPPAGPPPGVCCPDPVVNVVVNVPPIVVPGYPAPTSPPPATPPPAVPPPPPPGPPAPPRPAPPPTVPPPPPPGTLPPTTVLPDVVKFDIDWCSSTIFKAITVPPPDEQLVPVNLVKWIPFVGSQANDALTSLWEEFFELDGPSTPAGLRRAVPARVVEAAAGWLERITGANVTYHATSLKYTAQYFDPQFIPDREPLIDLYHRGYLGSRDQYVTLTRALGHCPLYSDMMLDAAQPRLGLPEYVRLLQMGEVSRGTFEQETRLIGYREPYYPDLAVRAAQSIPDPIDAVTYYWRGYTDRRGLDGLLQANGIQRKDYRDLFVDGRTFLPPPSDAIRWAIKDVFDPEDLGRAEKIAEFEEQVGLRETLRASGIFPTTIYDEAGKPLLIDTPLNYWITSYEECSPTQGYEMLHRLRPERVNRFPLEDEEGNVTYPEPVDITLLRRLLKEKDFNPIWRDRLAAISSATVGRIDLRRLYEAKVFGPPLFTAGFRRNPDGSWTATGKAEVELYERYRDDKYVPEDAQALAYFTAWDIERQKRSKLDTRHLSVLCSNYKLGALSRGDLEDQSGEIYQDPAIGRRFAAMCDAELRRDLLKTAVAGIKRQFMSGELSEAQTRTELGKVGVRQVRIDQLVETWKHARVGPRRYASAAQLIAWYIDGQQSRADTLRSVVNLGYEPEAARRMVRHAEIGQLAKSAKEQQRIEADRQRQADKLAAARKKEQDTQTKAQETVFNRFLSRRSEKNLKAWLHDGTITRSDVRQTLILKGYSPDDADRWLHRIDEVPTNTKEVGE